MYKKVKLPLGGEDIRPLRAGDAVLLTGTIYTARDAAHRRLCQMLEGGKPQGWPLPDPCAIYYAGPCPAAPGEVIGPCGPTTSARMDGYTPAMISAGATALIGKGPRSKEVLAALEGRAVYFAVTGGAGMLIQRSVKRAELVAFEDLGAEAIRRMEVADLPAIVACDGAGGDLYARAR